MTNQKTHKLKAINSDHDVCQVCGKTQLQRVMWLVELDADGNETAEPFPAGTTCGARLLGVKTDGGAKRVAGRVRELADQQISDAKLAIMTDRSQFWLIRNTYLPIDLAQQLRGGLINMSDALAARAERFPILTYFPYCEHMTIDEALALI